MGVKIHEPISPNKTGPDRLDWHSVRDRIDLARIATTLMGPAPGRRGERGRKLWWRCPFHQDSKSLIHGRAWQAVVAMFRLWRAWRRRAAGDEAPELVVSRGRAVAGGSSRDRGPGTSRDGVPTSRSKIPIPQGFWYFGTWTREVRSHQFQRTCDSQIRSKTFWTETRGS